MHILLAIAAICALVLGFIRRIRWRLGHFDTIQDDARQLPDPDECMSGWEIRGEVVRDASPGTAKGGG